jgi:glyoxylase-like metal-dependent hydrolase (beta-lactamase superfamily II)
MAEIRALDVGAIQADASYVVYGRMPGKTVSVPTIAYLVLGAGEPILVDTGFRHPDVLERVGMSASQERHQLLKEQLREAGVRPKDVRWILHTHLHLDHCGRDDAFPAATVVINRRELEFSVSGLMGELYSADETKHLVDRLHRPGALRLLDLELTGPEEIAPGVVCETAGGHTEGSMNVVVETADGAACICGDVFYNIDDQLGAPLLQVLDLEPAPTDNPAPSRRSEIAAMKRASRRGRFLLPMHDWPAEVAAGRVVGRPGRRLPAAPHSATHRDDTVPTKAG